MLKVRSILAVAFLAAVLLAAGAGQAQNVAEGGWLKLFDGETLYGWTVFGDAGWEVKDGMIVCEKGNSGFLATTSEFADFELVAKMRVSEAGSGGLALRTGLDGYAAETGGGAIVLPARKDAEFAEIHVKAVGGNVEVTVNGKASPVTVTRSLGHIALQYQRYHRDKKQAKVEISEVKLRPIGMTALFNGTDLSGWTPIADHKSEFSVVDGALNIKNGNGQIETAGTYKNFLLQLDIFSNGDHLNSGVFFRTPVGVFWKGTEIQVRNEWEGDDRTNPVDTGTGGVYGLCPSRKVVSTDREWFNMTIVANGYHYAAWLNGYQVSDYYDTRPPAREADGKNGYVPDAGTINLQGHDPTTDLSFKNINIQSHPEK
jgi:hypothetical protein